MRTPCRKQFKQLPLVLFLPVQPSPLHYSLVDLNDSRWVLEDKNEKVVLSTVLSSNETFSSIFGTYMFNFVRTCSTWWERHGFPLQDLGRIPYFGLGDENGSEELCRHSQACHIGYSPRVSFKMKVRGWRHGSEVKSAGCFFRDWSLVPSTYIRWLKAACNSNCRDFTTFSGFCWHVHTGTKSK